MYYQSENGTILESQGTDGSGLHSHIMVVAADTAPGTAIAAKQIELYGTFYVSLVVSRK